MNRLLQQLRLRGDLRCEVNGNRFVIRIADRDIVVEVPDAASCWKLYRASSSLGFFRRIRWLERVLADSLTSLEIRVKGHSTVRIGHGVRSRWARLLGLRHSYISSSSIVALLRNKPA